MSEQSESLRASPPKTWRKGSRVLLVSDRLPRVFKPGFGTAGVSFGTRACQFQFRTGAKVSTRPWRETETEHVLIRICPGTCSETPRKLENPETHNIRARGALTVARACCRRGGTSKSCPTAASEMLVVPDHLPSASPWGKGQPARLGSLSFATESRTS